jgi:hypothetical protein
MERPSATVFTSQEAQLILREAPAVIRFCGRHTVSEPLGLPHRCRRPT